jgi:ribose 5-phosphate isomerase A
MVGEQFWREHPLILSGWAKDDMVRLEDEKRAAAEAAAELAESGMTVGLGTGSTVAYLLDALSRRALSIRCVATSPRTETAARALGLRVGPFDQIERLDLAIDGADQIAPDGWLVKGGGGAHTREKLVASSADRFVVIADSSKPVAALHPPVPLELLAFGLASTSRRLKQVARRDVALSPDGGVIADYTGDFSDPVVLATWLRSASGVIEHGLFPPEMVSTIMLGRSGSVDVISFAPAP